MRKDLKNKESQKFKNALTMLSKLVPKKHGSKNEDRFIRFKENASLIILSVILTLAPVLEAQGNVQTVSNNYAIRNLIENKIIDDNMINTDDGLFNSEIYKKYNKENDPKSYAYAIDKYSNLVNDKTKVSRAEGAKIFSTLMGYKEDDDYINNNFKDVPQNSPYLKYINWCKNNKVINGYPNGDFGYDDNLTIVQSQALLLKCLGFTNIKYNNVSEFADAVGITKNTNFIGIRKTDSEISISTLSQFINNTLKSKTTDDKILGEKLGILNKEVLPAQDTLVILVNFKDAKIVNSHSEWNQYMFGEKSVARYLRQVSNNTIKIKPAKENMGKDSDGIVEVTIDKDYGKYLKTGEFTDRKIQRGIITESLKKADKFVDFKIFDKDNNGVISRNELNLVYFIANKVGNETEEFRAYFTPLPFVELKFDNVNINNVDIESFKTNSFVKSNGVEFDLGKQASGAIFIPANINDSIYPKSVTAHELLHAVVGAKDLYDDNGERSGLDYLDIMANDGKTSYPIGISAYTKIQNDFVKPIEISLNNDNKEFTFNIGYNQIIKINTNDPNEYYLIENRQFKGIDQGLKSYYAGNGGIIIYRVNEYVSNDIDHENHKQNVRVEESSRAKKGYYLFDHPEKYRELYETDIFFNTDSVSKFYFSTKADSLSIYEEEAPPNAVVEVLDESKDQMRVKISFLKKVL